MKASKIREKNSQELTQLRDKIKRDLMDARFKNIMGQLGDKSSLVKLRRDVARINTVIKERL